MAEPPRRRPPARRPVPRKPPPRRRPAEPDPRARIAGGIAVAAILVVAIVAIVLISGSGGSGDDTTVAAGRETPTPTPTATATATPKPDPTPRPLTNDQREMRDQAAGIVKDRGYTVTRLRDFQPRKTLQVLIGRSGSGNELAFFFVDGEYIGNDSTSSSKSLTYRNGGGRTSVVLRYATFSPGDAPGAKPTGDPVDVTFRWDGTRLEPSPAIPPVASRSR